MCAISGRSEAAFNMPGAGRIGEALANVGRGIECQFLPIIDQWRAARNESIAEIQAPSRNDGSGARTGN